MKHEFEVGDLVRVTGTVKNKAGQQIDPATVKFSVKPPNGIVTTYTYGIDAQLVRESQGNYRIDINANAPGLWHYRFFSTGSEQAAKEDQFRVKPTQFP
jgi:uncharacterized protein YfaS (alpha-2-macroglobulin family)